MFTYTKMQTSIKMAKLEKIGKKMVVIKLSEVKY